VTWQLRNPNLLYGSENWTIKARDEIYEKNSRINLDRL
jgi:hypothetical protein